MSVIDPMFPFPPKSWNRFDFPLCIPYFKMICIETYPYFLTDKPAVHGIHIVLDNNSAALPHPDIEALAIIKTALGKRYEYLKLFLKAHLPSGVYLYILQAGGYAKSQKLLLMR